MSNQQNTTRRTLIIGHPIEDCTRVVSDCYLYRLNCEVTSQTYAVSAAQALKQEHFPLIILPVRVAPGDEIDQAKDLPELRGIWNAREKDEERYFKTSLQLVKYAREEGNPNKHSLIIFADTFSEERDALIQDVERRVLRVGADAYINLMHEKPLPPKSRLLALINNRLGWTEVQ